MSEGPVVNNHGRNSVSVANATAITAVDALGELFLSDFSTLGAFLGSSARIDFLCLATSFFDFVACKGNQLRPSGVVNVFGQHSSGQTFDVEVFKGDFAEPRGEIGGNFVQVVCAAARSMRGELGEARLDLTAALRSAFASGEGALKPALLLRRLLGEVGPFDHFAGGERSECRQANVDADGCVVDWLGGGFDLDVEDHEPLAVLAGEDRGFRDARKLAMPAHFDFARDSDEAQLAGFSQREAVADAEISGMIAVARAETGEASLGPALQTAEESRERLLQLAQHLLFGAERPARQVRRGDANSLQFCGLILVTQRNLAAFVSCNPLFKAGIVEHAKIRKHLTKRSRLRIVGINAVFVAQYHGLLAFLVFDMNYHHQSAERR
jgi:hypothetical protein